VPHGTSVNTTICVKRLSPLAAASKSRKIPLNSSEKVSEETMNMKVSKIFFAKADRTQLKSSSGELTIVAAGVVTGTAHL